MGKTRSAALRELVAATLKVESDARAAAAQPTLSAESKSETAPGVD